MSDSCECCGYELSEDDQAGDHCPKCGESFFIPECENCGFQPDEDALASGLADGYCPKCAHEWEGDDEDECEHAFDFSGECMFCNATADET